MSKRKSLLATITLDDQAPILALRRSGQEQLRIFTEKLRANPDQPRKVMDEASILRLAADIRERGLLQPIRVMAPDADGVHQIIAGERRWRAAQKAGLEVLDCVVDYEVQNEDQAFDQALAENVQRQDLSRPELAAALQRVKDRFGLTNQSLAERYSMSEEWVTQHLAFGALDPAVQGLMESRGAATALAKSLRGIRAEEQLAVLQAVLDLPNRDTQLDRLAEVKERQRQGAQLHEALAAAIAPPVADGRVGLPGVRPVGRPRADEASAEAFTWSPFTLNGEAGAALLRVTFGRLALIRLARAAREAPISAYAEALESDLLELRRACTEDEAGAELWKDLSERLSASLSLATVGGGPPDAAALDKPPDVVGLSS